MKKSNGLFLVLSGCLVAGAAGAAQIPGGPAGTIAGIVSAAPPRFLNETVVYLKSVPGSYVPTQAVLDQVKMEFVPHVLAITEGDTVEFTNHDTMSHNVFSPDHERYNLGSMPPGSVKDYTFAQPGSYTQLCNLHPEMLAYVFVGQNPYMSVVEPDGSFTIQGVPAGNYEIAVWNSHLKGADQTVSVTPDQTSNVTFSIHR